MDLFLLSAAFLLVVITFQRTVKFLRKRMKEKLLNEFEPVVFGFIYSGNNIVTPWINKLPYLPFVFDKNYVAQILCDYLLSLKRNLKGKESEALTRLFKALRLQKGSLKKITSKKKFQILKGLEELRELADKNYYTDVLPLFQTDDQEIKVGALRALIRMTPLNSLNILKKQQIYFTEWDLVYLHSELAKSHEIPDFRCWLKSGNLSYVKFSIKMISQFKQYDAIPDLIELLEHHDEQVVIETLKTLRSLNAFQACDNLTYGLFLVKSDALLEEYLKTIIALGGDTFDLIDIYRYHENKSIRRLIAGLTRNTPEKSEEELLAVAI